MNKYTRSLSLLVILVITGLCAGQAGQFISHQSGNWNNTYTWDYINNLGNTVYPCPYLPSNTEYIYIDSGHTITVTENVTVDSLIIMSTGRVEIDSGITLSVGPSGQGIGIGVNGTLIVRGTLLNAGLTYAWNPGTITFTGTGKYIHAQNGGYIPFATWSVGSECEVTGYISGTKPGSANQNFYNFTWNCPGQLQNIDLGWYNNTIGGSITIKSTGAGNGYQLRMTSPSAGSPNTITVLGNVNVTGGDFSSNGSGSSGIITVNQYGNINITGGTFSASRGSGTTVRWNLFGNFTVSGPVTLSAGGAGVGSSCFVFAKTGVQSIFWAGPITYANGNVNFEISPLCTLRLGTDWQVSNLAMAGGNIDLNGKTLSYSSTTNGTLTYNATTQQSTSDTEFPISSGPVNLVLNNSTGVTLHSPRTIAGMVTLGGNNTFTNLHYLSGYTGVAYAATIAQVTGSELPTSITNLTINNPNGVTLTASEIVSGTLTLVNGKLSLGQNNVKTRKVTTVSPAYVVTDGTGTLTVDSVGTTPITLPVGTASSYNPLTLSCMSGNVDNFTVRVDSGVYDTSTCNPSRAVQRTWTISEDNPGAGTISATFQWNSAEAGSAMSGSKIIWRYDTSWMQVGSYGVPTDNGNGTYVFGGSIGMLPRYARFTVGDTGLLPTQTIAFVPVDSPAYVSPVGDDSNPGTIELPYKTLSKALSAAIPGNRIYLRGGTYSDSATVKITQSGLAGYYIDVWAYPGETPVFDFTTQPKGNTAAYDGLSISGSYLHFKGIEVKLAGHNGIYITGSHNIIERCVIHDNTNTGLHMRHGASYNLILNCDSYFNFDPPSGGDADGFSAKWEVGVGNVFRGCRSYNNSDDGWDLWMAVSPVEIDSCWAFRNGVDIWHTGSVNGNGNGFKLGGNYVATHNLVTRCLAFDNAGNTGNGFDENNNLAGQTLYNCTSYLNKSYNYRFANTVTEGSHVFKNCISYKGTVNITSGTLDHNSWQGFTVTDADFKSLDTSLGIAPRNADGSLPGIDLLHLASGSSMIDAGVDVGLPFFGISPDLGSFESNASDAVISSEIIPNSFGLAQNYPNPFNPITTIQFSIPTSQLTILKVYDIIGREIATLVNEMKPPGTYTVQWDASNLPSGVYMYKLKNGKLSESKKLVLLK